MKNSMELVVAVWGMILEQNGAHIGGMIFFGEISPLGVGP